MAICPQYEFNNEIKHLAELLDNVRFYSSFSQKQEILCEKIEQNTDNLFCILNKLKRNELFMLEFTKNQILFCQVLDSFKALFKSETRLSKTKEILKLLISMVDNVFEDDFRCCETISTFEWTFGVYKQFILDNYKEICQYLKEYHIDDDITFVTIEYDLFAHILKCVPLENLIKINFLLKELEKLSNYCRHSPEKFYKILSQISQNLYLFHYELRTCDALLLKLLRIIFDGYNILCQHLKSDNLFRTCCVLDLVKLSISVQKFTRIIKYKDLSELNLKLLDLIIYLVREEFYYGNNRNIKSIRFFEDCLESLNNFIIFDRFENDYECKLRYETILIVLIDIIRQANRFEFSNCLLDNYQTNKAFEIIKNTLKYNKIDISFFYDLFWPEIKQVIFSDSSNNNNSGIYYLIEIFFKLYNQFDAKKYLIDMIDIMGKLLELDTFQNGPIFIFKLQNSIFLCLKILHKLNMEEIFLNKLMPILKTYNLICQQLDSIRWLSMQTIYFYILENKDRKKYFLHLDELWSPLFIKIIGNFTLKKFSDIINKEVMCISRIKLSLILNLIDFIFTYLDGKLIEKSYVTDMVEFLEYLYREKFEYIEECIDSDEYYERLSLSFIIQKLKDL